MKSNALIGLGILTVIAIVFVNAKNYAITPAEGGYEIGSTVEDFELKNIDGKTVSTASYADAKGFIVVFTCNTCPYSKMYEKRIDQLNQKYASKGYPVLAINSNDQSKSPGDSYEAMVQRADDKDYTFPYLYDDTQKIAARFGATRTPHVYIVQKSDNDMKVAYIGTIDNNPKDANSVSKKYVENAVDDLLAKRKVATDVTKAIGCGIKWKES